MLSNAVNPVCDRSARNMILNLLFFLEVLAALCLEFKCLHYTKNMENVVLWNQAFVLQEKDWITCCAVG